MLRAIVPKAVDGPNGARLSGLTLVYRTEPALHGPLPAGSLRPYDCRWPGTARTRIGSRRAVQEWNNDAIVLGTGLSKHGYDNNIYEKPAFDKYREVARMLAKDKYGECGTH